MRRQFNGTAAKYVLSDFTGAHWSQEAGGRGGTQPGPFIFGYVQCDRAVEGEVGHSGSHGPCPHRIKVCVVAKDNTGAVMALPKIKAVGHGRPPSAAVSARERILQVLEESKGEPLLNVDLWKRADLSKAHGNQILEGLIKSGEIVSALIYAPNKSGHMQKQRAWTLNS